MRHQLPSSTQLERNLLAILARIYHLELEADAIRQLLHQEKLREYRAATESRIKAKEAAPHVP